MNNRNLYDCKHLLKNFAKKSKQISYSTALLVTFMITGSIGYSAEINESPKNMNETQKIVITYADVDTVASMESEYQELLKKEAEKVAELKIEKVELENEIKELKEKSVQKESVLEKLEMDSQIRWHRAEYKKLLKDYKDYYTRLDKKIDEDEEKLIELTKLINVLE